MKILLTGATGFVGSHVLEALLKDKHSVCLLKRSFSDIRRVQELIGQCIVYNLDKIALEEIYEENQIDCIVHCATHYGRSNKEYDKNIDANLSFPLKLLCLGAEKGVKYFINTDTFSSKQFICEESLDGDIYMSGYTLSKVHFRQWGRMIAAQYGIKFINMRLEHVYGDGDSEGKFVPYVLKVCSSNEESLALSKGSQLRDFIHISDVVNAYRAVIENLEKEDGVTYKTYEVGTGKMRSLRDFVELLHDIVHSTTILKWGERPMGKGELMQSKADNTELLKIGWHPLIVENEDIRLIMKKHGFT